MEHVFTKTIINILKHNFGKQAKVIYENSNLLQYINIKTVSVSKDSKSRSSFANLYAIYVLVEDYIKYAFEKKKDYSKYTGANFSDLFYRQRDLPFGNKLQNHALNNRLNEEYKKYFFDSKSIPIIRNSEKKKYWINENLLKIKIKNKIYDISKSIMAIIKEYIKAKQESFNLFIETCNKFDNKKLSNKEIKDFIFSLIEEKMDARIFEIVSFSILKYYYCTKHIYFGKTKQKIKKEILKLFKTGRTNANDGGIDFVMKPLGRFFQVTESLDFKKYFLDIDKIEKYPITFIIKTKKSEKDLKKEIYNNALLAYSIPSIVKKYMNCIEEIFNIPKLQKVYNIIEKNNLQCKVVKEILLQSKVEFNYDEKNRIDFYE